MTKGIGLPLAAALALIVSGTLVGRAQAASFVAPSGLQSAIDNIDIIVKVQDTLKPSPPPDIVNRPTPPPPKCIGNNCALGTSATKKQGPKSRTNSIGSATGGAGSGK
jgi:hypothetical protein